MSHIVSLRELKEALESNSSNTAFIDVRTPAEYRSAHIPGVENIPLNELEKHIAELSKKDKVYVHCQAGGRTDQACTLLERYHLANLYRVDQGITAWENEGWEVIRGTSKMISIMRQAQILSGLLVIISIALGWTMHPAWYGLAACVGVGWLFAGISGTCAMVRILGKMPWNR